MQDDGDLFEPGELVPDYPELQSLAQSLLQDSNDIGSAPFGLDELGKDEWTPRSSIALDLNELLSDSSGEIVLASEAQLSLTSSAMVTDAGFVDQHVTSDGEDVSGFAYLSFDTGVTVYYSSNADLTLDTIVS